MFALKGCVAHFDEIWKCFNSCLGMFCLIAMCVMHRFADVVSF